MIVKRIKLPLETFSKTAGGLASHKSNKFSNYFIKSLLISVFIQWSVK